MTDDRSCIVFSHAANIHSGKLGFWEDDACAAVASRLALPHVELDSLFHQQNWEPLPNDEFKARVQPLVESESWVVDGNYTRTGVQELIWERADAVVWLDLPRMTVMRRVTVRSLKRTLTGEALWNGNKESWRNLISSDPERNLLVWTWNRYHPIKEHYETSMDDTRWSHLRWIRLRTQREIDTFNTEASL